MRGRMGGGGREGGEGGGGGGVILHHCRRLFHELSQLTAWGGGGEGEGGIQNRSKNYIGTAGRRQDLQQEASKT